MHEWKNVLSSVVYYVLLVINVAALQPYHPVVRRATTDGPALSPSLSASKNDDNVLVSWGRRDLLRTMRQILVGTATTATITSPQVPPALAAPPMTPGEADNVGARLFRQFRDSPRKLLRPPLNQQFAVLLMRSSYEALDLLDVVAMDQFQRDFFLTRQAEYQPYVGLLGAGFVKQGELSDAYYFDFISFAQYKAINREITMDPAFVFEEQQPKDVGDDEPQSFLTTVIKRDPTLSNAMLPAEHSRLVGKRILDRLDELYRGTQVGLPTFSSEGQRATPNQLLEVWEQLIKIFLLNGFAWDGKGTLVSQSTNGKVKYCLTLTSPATIWGGRALQKEKCPLGNDFLMKVARLVAQRYGYRVIESSLAYEGTTEVNYLTVV